MSDHMQYQVPSVTVVMPCFNAAATIAASIASVQGQSITDWELFVVDDGSADNSAEIVAKAAAHDGRIHLVEQENAGPSVARQRGVASARASVVAFLDSDDLWHCDHLRLALEMLDADPRLGVAFAPCRLIDGDGWENRSNDNGLA